MDKSLIIAGGALLAVAAATFWLWTPDIPRDRLETLYLRAQADMIEAAGASLHVRIDGPADAPAVIFLHGFGSSLHTWDGWAESLSGRYRVARLDLPGSGLSPPDPTGRYDDERAFELVSGVMAHLGVEQAAIVGNSVGGRIAWSFAAAYPEKVTRLVLVAPDGFASTGFEYGEAPEVGAVTHAMRVVMPRSLVRMNLAQSYADPDRLDAETVDRYFALLRAPGARRALIHRMEQTVLEPPEDRLRAIQSPVLVLWGEQDRLIPVSNAQDYMALLPDAELVVLPDAGHLPQEEIPQRSLEPVARFLDEGDAP